MNGTLTQDEFNSLDNDELGTACFEPILHAYKISQTQGEDFSTGLYTRLTSGQRALFGFWSYYTHVMESEAEFYWWSAYFIADGHKWAGLKEGLSYFGDQSTLYLLEEFEGILIERDHPRELGHFNITRDDLYQDEEFLSMVCSLYAIFHESLFMTLDIIGNYIRNNPQEFILLNPYLEACN